MRLINQLIDQGSCSSVHGGELILVRGPIHAFPNCP